MRSRQGMERSGGESRLAGREEVDCRPSNGEIVHRIREIKEIYRLRRGIRVDRIAGERIRARDKAQSWLLPKKHMFVFGNTMQQGHHTSYCGAMRHLTLVLYPDDHEERGLIRHNCSDNANLTYIVTWPDSAPKVDIIEICVHARLYVLPRV
jgi:hypothetical protein